MFKVTRQEVVELDDSDDEDVQIVEADSGNESGDVRELRKKPDEDIADQDDEAGADEPQTSESGEEERISEAGGEDHQMHEASEEEDNKVTRQDTSNQPSTSQSPAKSAASILQKLREKHDNLRHWKKSKIPLIDPLPMKRGRKKKEPQQPVAGPSGVNLAQGAPRKRGRPPKELQEERKKKLAAIAPPVEEKPKEPKPARDVKIKITKNNRGSFLCEIPGNSDDTSEDTE